MGKFSVTEIERFWTHVDKTPGHGPKGDCWVWTAWRLPAGYGMYNIKRLGKKFLCHRFVLIVRDGEIPDGIQSLHSCDFPPCCREDHLFYGTQGDNLADAAKKGRMASGDKHGLRKHPERVNRGESHPTAKISDEIVRLIRSKHFDGVPISKIAVDFSVSRTHVFRIVHGLRRKDSMQKPSITIPIPK